MKTINTKIGLILTALLVVAVLSYGFWSNSNSGKNAECSSSDKQSSSNVQSKLNLKGMTRHLLDFYK